MRRAILFFYLSLFPVTASICSAQTETDFTGAWALQVHGKNLIVLKLEPGTGASPVAGSLARPAHFRLSGPYFSAVSSEIGIAPIVSSAWHSGSLDITVQNPKDPSDKDGYQLSLNPDHSLSMRFADLDPWILNRVAGSAVVAADWGSTRSYALDDTGVSSPEMAAIFEADQKPRAGDITKIDWKVLDVQDAERRDQVRRLLKGGKLHTGEDFNKAAFLFQHGATPDDYLLAHTLAMIAVARGDVTALWIATATLDRYLQSIGKPQIYGTQFKWNSENQPTTQDPYNRALIADSLRRALGVPVQAIQEEQRQKYDADRHLPATTH